MGSSVSDIRSLNPDQVVGRIAEYFHSRGITLTQAFTILDGNRSNFVSWEEFERGIMMCLENSGIHRRLPKEDLLPIFRRFDLNSDGRLSLDEFASQFQPATSAIAREWFQESRRGPGAGLYSTGYSTPGYSTPVGTSYIDRSLGMSSAVAPEVYDSKRIDWVLSRIAGAVHRAGYSASELFNTVDLDHNGRLDYPELERVICSFQPDLSTTEKQMVFRRFDRDGTNDIDIREFCSILENSGGASVVAVEDKLRALGEKFKMRGLTLHTAFSAFDNDHTGYLNRAQWQRAISIMAPDISLADQENIFRKFDMDGDGYLSIHEFQLFFQDSMDRSLVYTPAGTTSLGTASYGTASYATGGLVGASSYATGSYELGSRSLGAGSFGERSWPASPSYPVEEPWERDILNTVRDCLSAGRSGLVISEVFRRLDVTGTNYMSLPEFSRMLCSYRRDLNPIQIERLFRIVNYSNSGQISLSEFIRRFG